MYYAHCLMYREQLLPHGAGRLFQQYCVDAYTKMEAQRLHWVRKNQASLRLEEHDVLKDWVAARGDASASSGPAKVGKPVVLPSSFGGSDRAMRMNYQDAMAIVRRYGKPDYFITFTANPMWPEIRENLWPADPATNRPELTARVFQLKLKALLHDLISNSILGKVMAYTWTIEFQKRGLPHAHILLIMRPDHKPRTPADIDKAVSAELPDKDDENQNPLLEVV